MPLEINSSWHILPLNAAVLNSSPRTPPLCIFCMSLFVNTPDSDHQLVRSALHAWTVFRLTCSLHRVHCSLHRVHCSLHSAHCSLHWVHCSLHWVHCSLHWVHCSLHCVHCSLHWVHCSLHCVHCSLHCVHCSLHCVHCSLHWVHCSLHWVHCSLHWVHCSLHWVHCSLHWVHCSLHWVHCSLHGVHCSLHRVHCSLLPEQGNPLKFTLFLNIHSWICAAQRLHARTSVTSYTSVNIYNFNSRLAQFNALWMEYIRSLRTGIMAEYPVMSTSQGTYVPIEQTSEAIRVTYEICRAGGARTGIENRCLNGKVIFWTYTEWNWLKSCELTKYNSVRLVSSLAYRCWWCALHPCLMWRSARLCFWAVGSTAWRRCARWVLEISSTQCLTSPRSC